MQRPNYFKGLSAANDLTEEPHSKDTKSQRHIRSKFCHNKVDVNLCVDRFRNSSCLYITI